ncbi:hypothetical protein PAXRUDRAFT_17687 [Paxillus rubicundulus Ve08.2h10]|uniref:Uncharacterized protein n=1 Tax=Paxillus rubicundulus Ve08.2h10 TaxID=930991 RepID=A0A0D0DGS8_9AGAM|nr:hypothetical protein PAXRUDRAFT_17687 [Paxillus rubicundulus Ve08.2h10]
MDATSANNVLNATAKAIVNLLWGEVQDGEWAIAVGRMDNAMHAAHAVIQHADVIPGILIAVEQLLHLKAAVWPNWMGMIRWTQESVTRHPWAQQGTIIQMEYKFGDSSTNDNEVLQPPKEPMGAEEKEVRGAQILQMKMEEDDEDMVYRRRQKEHAKGKKRADAMEGESLLGKRKADEALEDATECRWPQMHRSSGKMTAAQPTLVHLPGSRMTTAKKAARPKQMTKAKRAAECRGDFKSEDEDPIGNMAVGSTSSADRMTAMPTPAPPSTPPRMPIPVPNPTQRRQGRQGRWRGAPQPLAAPQPVNACSTCINFGVLCEPNLGYLCFTCRSRKKNPDQWMHSHSEEHPPDLEHHPRLQPQDCDILRMPLHLCGTPVNTQPPANPQDRPNTASSSTGIILCIPPSQATHKMESAPKTSAVKAPINMGLILGTAYSFGGNPLVSHEEHRAVLQWLETVEVENHELHGLITQALDHIEVLEQGMALLGRICEVTQQSVATSQTDFDRANMGFPFKQEHPTAASHQELGPAQPSHSPSPSLSSNTISIPSAVNLGMRWHIGPAIIQSTTPILPSTSPWTSSDTRRSRSMPATGTIYSGPQMLSANDPPILPPVSPTISIPPVKVLVEMESASDNVGNGSSE